MTGALSACGNVTTRAAQRVGGVGAGGDIVLKKRIHPKMTVLLQTRGFGAQNGVFWAQNDGGTFASSWGTLPPMGAAMALLADPLDQPMNSMVNESSDEPKLFPTRKKVDIQAFLSPPVHIARGLINSPENRLNFPTTASE